MPQAPDSQASNLDYRSPVAAELFYKRVTGWKYAMLVAASVTLILAVIGIVLALVNYLI